MIRSALLAIALCTGASLLACSVVIDVPADCADVNCLPYVCGSDRIECLDSCSSDAECTGGFVCDVGTNRCEPTGCQALFEPVALGGLPATVSEFEIGVGGSPEQLMVLIGRNQGLGFRRFNINGAVVEDPPDPDLGLVRVAEANENQVRFSPVVRYVDGRDSGADGSTPRFLMAWRVSSGIRDSFQVGTFVVDPPSPPSVRTLWEERSRTDISSLDLRPNGNGLLATWRAQSGQTGELFSVETSLQGVIEDDDAPELISPPERLATFSSMIRVNSTHYVAFTTAGDGVRDLGAVALDGSNTRLGAVRIRDEQPAGEFQVADLQAVQAGDGAGVFIWVEDDGDGDAPFMALINDDVTRVLDPETTVSVPPLELATGYTRIAAVRSADGPDGFLVGWLGERFDRFDLWIQRYAADGTPRFTALPATSAAGARIDNYRLVSTATGLAVVWLSTGRDGNPDQLFYRRFECEE